MTLLTYPEAVDNMNARFLAAWNAETAAIVGYVPEIRWDGNEKKAPPPGGLYFVIHSVQNVKDGQSTLSNNVSRPGVKRFTSIGLVIMQLYMPKNVQDPKPNGRALAMIAKNAYRSGDNSSGIWFKNVRINDLPSFEDWYRLNVIAEYQYDELA